MLCRSSRLSSSFSHPDTVVPIDSDFGVFLLSIVLPQIEIIAADGSEHIISCRDVARWPAEDRARLTGCASLIGLSPLAFVLELTGGPWVSKWQYAAPGPLALISSRRTAVPGTVGLRHFGEHGYLFRCTDRVILVKAGETRAVLSAATISGVYTHGEWFTVQMVDGSWAALGPWTTPQFFEAKLAVPGPRCVFLVRGRTVEHVDLLTGAQTVLASSLGKAGGLVLPKNLSSRRLVYCPRTGDLLVLRTNGTVAPLILRGLLAPSVDLNPMTFAQFPPEIRELVRTFLYLSRGRWSSWLCQYLLTFVFMNVPCVVSFFGRPTK